MTAGTYRLGNLHGSVPPNPQETDEWCVREWVIDRNSPSSLTSSSLFMAVHETRRLHVEAGQATRGTPVARSCGQTQRTPKSYTLSFTVFFNYYLLHYLFT